MLKVQRTEQANIYEPQSTCIARVVFYKDTRQVLVNFRRSNGDGMSRAYECELSEEQVEQWMSAPSVGGHFNKYIFVE